MISDPQPVLPLLVPAGVAAPLPVLPLSPAPPPLIPASPRPGEPNTDAHRRRLQGLIRRLSVIGTILGGLLFLVLFCMMVWPEDLYRLSGDLGGILELLAAAAFMMSGMLLFYSLRARTVFRRLLPVYISGVEVPDPLADRRPPMPFLKSDLNKIRLMAAPLLVTLLLMLAVDLGARSTELRTDLMPLWLAAAYVGCCLQLIAVRRAAWEIARMEGVPFDAVEARGFAVLAGGANPGRMAPLPVEPVQSAFLAPSPAPAPAALEVLESANAFSDWETMLHVMAVLGLGTYVVWLYWCFLAVIEMVRERSLLAFVIGAGTLTNLLWALTQFLVAVSALAWIAWCVAGLSFGPRFRTIAIVLAWSGVGLAVIALLVALGRLDDSSPAVATYRTAVVINPPTTSEDDRASAFQAIVTSALFPVVMLILLTRPPVKELFAHRPRRRAARRTT